MSRLIHQNAGSLSQMSVREKWLCWSATLRLGVSPRRNTAISSRLSNSPDSSRSRRKKLHQTVGRSPEPMSTTITRQDPRFELARRTRNGRFPAPDQIVKQEEYCQDAGGAANTRQHAPTPP